jgi:cell division protein FtsQ
MVPPRTPRESIQPVSPGPSLFDMLSERGPKPQEPQYKGIMGIVARTELKVRAWAESMPWRKLGRGALALAFMAALGGLYVYRAPVIEHVTLYVAKATGAVVQSIVVSGVTYTGKEDLANALQLHKGDSLVGFDAAAARARIEALPWVRLASVDRQLPDAVNVTVYEHIPLARLLDADEKVWVIDREGKRIVSDTNNTFATLPLVEGEGAAEAAGELFLAMGNLPALVGQLKEAVYVGHRRWDLKFVSGVTVMLPEETPAYSLKTALPLLARLEESRHVLTLPGGTVDLRLPDRVILNLPDGVGATPVTTKPAQAG